MSAARGRRSSTGCYARRHGGAFILRIEDTDAERSSDEMVAGILEGLRWLGLDWDEGPDVGGPHAPYFQSQRYDRHREFANGCWPTGHAYPCYCSPDLLKQKREDAESTEGWGGNTIARVWLVRRDQQRSVEASGLRPAIRFKVPPGVTSYRRSRSRRRFSSITSRSRTSSSFDPTACRPIISRSWPTIIDMQITHVIRGDDHISNTPKHSCSSRRSARRRRSSRMCR